MFHIGLNMQCINNKVNGKYQYITMTKDNWKHLKKETLTQGGKIKPGALED